MDEIITKCFENQMNHLCKLILICCILFLLTFLIHRCVMLEQAYQSGDVSMYTFVRFIDCWIFSKVFTWSLDSILSDAVFDLLMMYYQGAAVVQYFIIFYYIPRSELAAANTLLNLIIVHCTLSISLQYLVSSLCCTNLCLYIDIVFW